MAWLSARWVERADEDRRRRTRTIMSVVALLLPLAWFKYYGFFALNLANAFESMGMHPPLPLLQVLLPIGISFYTFMSISYLVDVSRYEITPSRFLDVSVYLAFFPHLIAGPIVRSEELIPQIRRPRDPGRIDVARASFLIIGGLFKKIVISSFLATQIVDPVFAAPNAHAGLEVLVAIYAYAIVIYADFSAYSDIAIGAAMLLGFDFPANFDRPYTAVSLRDFWRRWHMTLSRWLRDYLYIPLGGSHGSRWQTTRNIMITMLLGGLWHGAAWTFVFWGALHGLGQAVGYQRRRARLAAGLPALPDEPRDRFWQRVATFHLVCLGWVFFRADSIGTAFHLLWRLLTAWGSAPLVTPAVVGVIALMIGAQYVPRDLPARVQDRFSQLRPAVQGLVLGMTLFAITTLGPQGVAPFIYFRF
jgi:D-alanyl-lipoteichoic acid acyltransferase DltB (MBOAT superfamily)